MGLGVGVTEQLTAYGELSALTADQDFDFETLNVGVKAGLKYNF